MKSKGALGVNRGEKWRLGGKGLEKDFGSLCCDGHEGEGIGHCDK